MSTEAAMIIVAVISALVTLVTLFVNRKDKKINEIWKEIKKSGKVNVFQMKMMFEIIDILDGKEINGQVKKLRKEAQEFTTEN